MGIYVGPAGNGSSAESTRLTLGCLVNIVEYPSSHVGCAVRSLVGNAVVGFNVGKALGCLLGLTDGANVGFLLFFNVGVAVGRLVGNWVGDAVGLEEMGRGVGN